MSGQQHTADSENTRYWKRNLVMVWLSQLLVMIGFDAAMPFIPLFLKADLGVVNEGECGIYVSMFAFCGVLGYAVFCPIWGTLSDRYGVRPMLLRGTLGTAFFFPMMGYVTQPWMLIVLRFITAACAGTTAASQILLVKTTPDERQGFSLGVLSTAIWGGSMVGNVVGGLVVDAFGYKATFWVCGILYFIAGVFILFTKDAPRVLKAPVIEQPEQNRKRKKTKQRPSHFGFTYGVWLMMILFLLYGFVRFFDAPYTAMLVELITGPAKAAYWTGIISAFVALGAILSGVVMGYLADKWRPNAMIVPALAVSVVTLYLQAATDNLWVFGIARTLMFFFSGSLVPVFQKVLSAATPQRKRGSVFGWSTTASNIGRMLATFLAGWTIFVCGTRGVFYAGAILSLILVPVAFWIIRTVMRQPYYTAHTQGHPCDK